MLEISSHIFLGKYFNMSSAEHFTQECYALKMTNPLINFTCLHHTAYMYMLKGIAYSVCGVQLLRFEVLLICLS